MAKTDNLRSTKQIASSQVVGVIKNGYPLIFGVIISVFVPIYATIPLLIVASFFTGYNVISSTREEALNDILKNEDSVDTLKVNDNNSQK